MYKKGGIIILIGLGIMVLAIIAMSIFYGSINNTIRTQNKQEIVTLKIDASGVNKLKIDTSNDKVVFVKTNSNEIEVTYTKSDELKYDLIKEADKIVLKKEKIFKLFNFNFGFIFNKSVTEIKIPEHLIKDIEVVNSNSTIELDGYNLENLNLTTSNSIINITNIVCINNINLNSSNGMINIENVKSDKSVIANTSNARITTNNSVANDFRLSSSNGGIDVQGISANNIDLTTSNSKVNVKSSDIKGKIYTKSSNGSIYIESNAKDNDITTSNASITIKIDDIKEAYNLQAKTSNDSIILNGDKLEDKNISKTYDNAAKSIILKTSNGAINIDYK